MSAQLTPMSVDLEHVSTMMMATFMNVTVRMEQLLEQTQTTSLHA